MSDLTDKVQKLVERKTASQFEIACRESDEAREWLEERAAIIEEGTEHYREESELQALLLWQSRVIKSG